MGGELDATSTLGEGSAFTIRLPLQRADAEAAPQAMAPAGEVEGLADCIVLVATPNPLAQSLMRAALQPEVRAVDVAGALNVALSALAVRRADLIVVDEEALGLGGRNGLANLATLVASSAGAQVAVLCAADGKIDDARLRAGGATIILRKPIAAGELVGQLKAAWRAPAKPKAARRGAAA